MLSDNLISFSLVSVPVMAITTQLIAMNCEEGVINPLSDYEGQGSGLGYPEIGCRVFSLVSEACPELQKSAYTVCSGLVSWLMTPYVLPALKGASRFILDNMGAAARHVREVGFHLPGILFF